MRIPKAIREYIYRDKGRCRICFQPVEKRFAHVHHLYHRYAPIPKWLEVPPTIANNHPYNLILVCSECHALLHTGDDLPRHARDTMIRVNKDLEYLFPFPEEVQMWLEENRSGIR